MKISKKIVLLGYFGVGKSSLIRRFVENVFSEDYKVTIGVHILKKEIQINNNENISLIIWDLEGSDNFEKIRESYLLGSHSFIYVFDVTRPSTFQNMNNDIELIKVKYPNVLLQVIGNKVDLVDLKTLQKKLKDNQIPYDYLTSAKTGDNVNHAFEFIAHQLIK
ncbi:GTP-binding protein [Abyssalbus ytuae]|uniref:GTP-binding protein n=2 Tax=Abyssalbus ytuae TaxID=2926907 RepID=A0A9E6ZV28_9FLAO|nr:Rab family GTPase [Abyssalbus ytuae]UOB19488.1 GTP-binding protein [Abyssalbus ytuae]